MSGVEAPSTFDNLIFSTLRVGVGRRVMRIAPSIVKSRPVNYFTALTIGALKLPQFIK